MIILSIFTGLGLLDKAFIDEGFTVVPLCEINEKMAKAYETLCGDHPIYGDIQDAFDELESDPDAFYKKLGTRKFDGIIGGPPCQSLSVTSRLRPPKFPDMTDAVVKSLEIEHDWYLFENVKPVEVPGSSTVKMNAMNYAKPHQNRRRYFTYSPNLENVVPPPVYKGNSTSLIAYPAVAGKVYGCPRAAILQGYTECLDLDIPKRLLEQGLANAVHYGLARMWAKNIRGYVGT